MALRGIFFDIDDTLYSTHDFARLARMNAVAAMARFGVRLPPDQLYDELLEVVREFSSNYDHHFDKLLTRLPAGATAGVNRAVIVAAAVAAYHDTKITALRPFDGAVELLTALSKAPIVRGVITDGLQIKQAEKLVRLGVVPLLSPNAVFISDQIGISKPNPKLYRRALDETGLRPSESLYVGDDPVNDIDPANAVGMIACLFRGVEREHRPGTTAPAHAVSTYGELAELLKREFGVGG